MMHTRPSSIPARRGSICWLLTASLITLLSVLPAVAGTPTVVSLSHPLCSLSGDLNDNDLYGCPIVGGGVLTITGTGFTALVNNVTFGCADVPIFVSSTQMTCTLHAGASHTSTDELYAVLTNGTTGSPGPRIHYASFPAVTDIGWYGPGCLVSGGSFPKDFYRCPFDGTVTVTIFGSNFQNIGPLIGATFFARDNNTNLCSNNMQLELTQTVSGGTSTSLICQFTIDPLFANGSMLMNGVLLTNGGNFTVFNTLRFAVPPAIWSLQVPTSTQVTPTSVIGAPTYWTIPSPGSAMAGVRATGLVQWSYPPIEMSGCQYSPAFDGGDTLNCTMILGAGAYLDVVVYNGPGFYHSQPNSGANVTIAATPSITSVHSDWCFPHPTDPLTLLYCPIFDTTFRLTINGVNFDQWLDVDVCVAGTLTRVNSTQAVCNMSTTVQDQAGAAWYAHVSGNGVTQYYSNAATIVWAPRPTFLSSSVSSCFGSGTKDLAGCPVNNSWISLNSTVILHVHGTNIYVAPACQTFSTAASTGAQPCVPGTLSVVSNTEFICALNLQQPLDTMTQTSFLVAGGWTDISTGGGGSITFAASPTVTAVDIPLCTYNAAPDNYTNCPFDSYAPNITVTGTHFDVAPQFTTVLMTVAWQFVCSPLNAIQITSISGAAAYTVLTCQLVADPAPVGGSVYPTGNVATNGGYAQLWTSLTYAMWPLVTDIASDPCVATSPLSLVDCPVRDNALAPMVVNLTAAFLQPDATVTMADHDCSVFARPLDLSHVVCEVNYTAVGGVAGTLHDLTIVNPRGYGFTRTEVNITFAATPVITALFHANCTQVSSLRLTDCPVNQSVADMAALTIVGANFDEYFEVSVNVCEPGSLVVLSSTDATCTAVSGDPGSIAPVNITSNGAAGYIPTSASLQYAPLPVITSITDSLCSATATASIVDSCPLAGSILTIAGLNMAVGPVPSPVITVTPNGYGVDPCVAGTTTFDPAGLWIECELTDLTSNVGVQVAGALGNLTVTTIGGTSLQAATVVYQPHPVITSLEAADCANNGSFLLFDCPVHVVGSVMLTIHGANFLPGATIVDATVCSTGTSLTVDSSTMIVCPLANFSGLAELKSVVVSNPALYGGANSTALASVQSTSLAPPTITAFYNPDCGQAGDGVSLLGCPTLGIGTLTVAGTNFDPDFATIVLSVCNGPLNVLSSTYGTCQLAANPGSSMWPASIRTNAGATVNSLVTLQYAVQPVLSQVVLAVCKGSGTAVLYECDISGGQTVWFYGAQFIGSRFVVLSDQSVPVCLPSTTVVYNTTVASCLLSASTSSIGTTLTHVSVQTFGGASAFSVTLSFWYPPVVSSVAMSGGCQPASLTSPTSFLACPFDPLFNLSVTVTGYNFTQGLAPSFTLLVGGVELCAPSSLSYNRTTIHCRIGPSWLSLPSLSVGAAVVATNSGTATVFSVLQFASRVSISHISSSACVVGAGGTGASALTDCPTTGNADSPFYVLITVTNLHSSSATVPDGVCTSVAISSSGVLNCTVNVSLTASGVALPIVVVDDFGYGDTTNGVAPVVTVAAVPSITSLSGSDSACQQNDTVSLKSCPIIGGNGIVINGLAFDESFQADVCHSQSIQVVSATLVTCDLIANSPGAWRNIRISSHGTVSWIDTAATVQWASTPVIDNISVAPCQRAAALDLFDCPLKAGAQLNISGQYLNTGALSITTVSGANPVCISSTIIVAADGTSINCTLEDFSSQLPVTTWAVSLSTNGGLSPQLPNITWWPLPQLYSVSAGLCHSVDQLTLVDCPLEAGVQLTVTGQYFKPDVNMLLPTECSSVAFFNSSYFICTMTYLSRSAVDVIVVNNAAGYGSSLELATVTGSPLTFPIISAFNSTQCFPSPVNAGSLVNCSLAGGELLTIIGSNFDLYNPVYVFDVVRARLVLPKWRWCPASSLSAI